MVWKYLVEGKVEGILGQIEIWYWPYKRCDEIIYVKQCCGSCLEAGQITVERAMEIVEEYYPYTVKEGFLDQRFPKSGYEFPAKPRRH